jgi:hypothetical protein
MKPTFCVIIGSSCRTSFFSRMKISLILVCLFAAILIAGCVPVVYRVNPDSPPKMGEKEARDAVELSLTLMQKSVTVAGVTHEGNLFRINMAKDTKGLWVTVYKAYGDVNPYIEKEGNIFTVRFGHPFYSLYWKSEDDARLFLDAVYSLRQWNTMGYKGMTAVASAPARKEKPQQIESASIATAPPRAIEPAKSAKSEETSRKVISAAPEPPKPDVSEKIPPKITITTPDISRTVAVAAKRTYITITGLAESNAGIMDVLVNGQQAELGEKGRFSSAVPLKVGQNKITVTAIDVFKNKSTTQFAVNREVSKTAAAKAETAAPKITITAPDTTRAVSVVAKRMNITVTGIAESKAGIMDVSVNGQDAELDEQGRFSTVIPLKVGQNTVTVMAIDVLENKSTKQFAVNREAGHIAATRAEEGPVHAELASAKYFALLIAVQDYDSGEIGKLDFAISDAQGLGDILVSRYTFDRENVITLVDPDRRTIYKTLQSLRSKLTERDNLLIFYAGHGYWLDDMKQGFWLPRDASGINDPADWIPNSTVRDYIKAIKAKHVLLVADSCFSGGIFKTREAFYKQKVSMEKIYELPSRKAITSGAMKTVPDRSVFLEYLIKRLKDNKEPYMDTQKLFASLREAVINNSPSHQTPLYGAISEAGDEGGDFIFVKRQ